MLMIFSKYLLSLTIALRCFHKILLGPEVDILLHLSMALVNSLFEKELYIDLGLVGNSSNKDLLTCQFCTELNV